METNRRTNRPDPPRDRRQRRSRRRLREAMLALLVAKGYENITIAELAEQADLNRATFYLHYDSKEQLLVDSLEAQFDELVAAMKTHGAAVPPWSPAMVDDLERIFIYVADNAELYRALLADNGVGYVAQQIIDYIAAVDEAQMRQALPEMELPMPLELLSRHIAGSFFANIAWWVTNDMPYSPRYMAEMVHQLCLQGVAGVIASTIAEQGTA
ncbi:MAG: TetR/AcrR family transcriptional regulator [Anaerolineales bacterium]|nr:TetR/AcrR family transcriptional regulator [Anaerolineales bacterium]